MRLAWDYRNMLHGIQSSSDAVWTCPVKRLGTITETCHIYALNCEGNIEAYFQIFAFFFFSS